MYTYGGGGGGGGWWGGWLHAGTNMDNTALFTVVTANVCSTMDKVRRGYTTHTHTHTL